jgi:hypothetical protein
VIAKRGFGMLGTHWRRGAGLRSVYGEVSGRGPRGGDREVSDAGWFRDSVTARMRGGIWGWSCEWCACPARLRLGLAGACVLLSDGTKIKAGHDGWRWLLVRALILGDGCLSCHMSHVQGCVVSGAM